MAYKLGLCGGPRGTHEAGVALFSDGKLVLAIQEERLNRFKNAISCWPTQAINQIFKRLGISPSEITEIAVPGESYKDMLERWPSYLNLNYGIETKKILQVNHQLAHAYAGFLSSNFEESMVITLDGVGDQLSGLVCMLSRSSPKSKILHKFENPLKSSIGFFWDAVTQVIGFESLEDAYKTMGLAAYGNPIYDFSDFLRVIDGVPILNDRFIQNQWKFIPHHPSEIRYSADFLGHYGFIPRRKQEKLDQVHADIAASAQLHLEKCVENLLQHHIKASKSRNLVLAGGVALNSKMMGRLGNSLYPCNLFVPQLPSDGSLAFGSGSQLLSEKEWSNFSYPGPYMGFEYREEEILDAIRYTGLKPLPYSPSLIVEYLSKNKVIGLYSGKSEYGPRALGSRSIIASPINPEMKDIVNKKIKFREDFRPFAPVIREVDSDKYFKIQKNCNYEYMNFVVDAHEYAKKNAPSIVHNDGTSRVQVLKSGTNNKLYDLLSEWAQVTSCHALLNTSFNLKGEPIVETPADAVRTFFSCDLDVLVLENYVLTKHKI